MTIERYLDSIEVEGMNLGAISIAEYVGHINDELFMRAIEYTSLTYPVLRSRIRHDNLGYVLEAAEDFQLDLRILDGTLDTVQSVAKEHWDPSTAVTQFILVRTELGGFFVFRKDHSVFDGNSSATIMRQIWQYYTDLSAGRDVNVETNNTLPESPMALFAGNSTSQRPRDSDAVRAAPLRANIDRYQHRIRFNEDDTTRIVSLSRAEKLSVHGLLCGTILIALRTLDPSPEPVRMTCLSIVNLPKHRMDVNISHTETTIPFTFHHAQVVLDCSDLDAIDVGRAVKSQLDTAIDAGMQLPEASMLGNPADFDGSRTNRFRIASVSNIGIIPALPHPDDVQIVDLSSLAQSTDRTPPYPVFAIYTYGNQLSIRGNCSPSLYTAEEFVELMTRIEQGLLHASSLIDI